MAFAKGQSGNPSGRVASKPFYDALHRAIAQDDAVRLRATAEKLLDLAAAGEGWAVKELAERLDGKAVQQIDATLSNPDGSGLFSKAVLEVVTPGGNKPT